MALSLNEFGVVVREMLKRAALPLELSLSKLPFTVSLELNVPPTLAWICATRSRLYFSCLRLLKRNVKK
jgi:hypothetical protein